MVFPSSFFVLKIISWSLWICVGVWSGIWSSRARIDSRWNLLSGSCSNCARVGELLRIATTTRFVSRAVSSIYYFLCHSHQRNKFGSYFVLVWNYCVLVSASIKLVATFDLLWEYSIGYQVFISLINWREFLLLVFLVKTRIPVSEFLITIAVRTLAQYSLSLGSYFFS